MYRRRFPAFERRKVVKTGFEVGDPVYLVSNPAKVGKVRSFCTPTNISATESASLVNVTWIDEVPAREQYHGGIRLCKCKMRIPIKTGGIICPT